MNGDLWPGPFHLLLFTRSYSNSRPSNLTNGLINRSIIMIQVSYCRKSAVRSHLSTNVLVQWCLVTAAYTAAPNHHAVAEIEASAGK
jgi:hypothetical protein